MLINIKTMIVRIILLCCVLVFCDAAFEGEKCTFGGVQGVCTLISECKSAIEALKKKAKPQNCGFKDMLPIVCCVDNAVPTKISTPMMHIPDVPIENKDRASRCADILPSITSKKTGQKAFDKCIDYQEKYVYPCEKSVAFIEDYARTTKCHNNADELISGGNDTKVHEFPHMVLLGYGTNEESIQWFCGGSIISENYILTAGHCIASRNLEVQYVLVGAHTRRDANDRSKIYKVKRIILHPGYEPPVNYNDIMLLETEKKIALSDFVVPACLHIGDPINDERVLATGWGNLGKWGSLSEVMQKVILEKFSTEECTRKFADNLKQLTRGYDPQSQICYGHRTEAKDTCKGDSGGPLQIKSKKIHCMYVIVGVTSFGRKCGLPAEPAIYTRVAHYLPWIESIVWP